MDKLRSLFQNNQQFRMGLVIVLTLLLTLCLHLLAPNMSHFMGKIVVPLSLFAVFYYLMETYLVGQTTVENLSPYILDYGHSDIGTTMQPDDADTQMYPSDYQEEIQMPREQTEEPFAYNASNVPIDYAFVGGDQSSFKTNTMNTCSGYSNLPSNFVAPIPGPQWMPQTAQTVQDRLSAGQFVPVKYVADLPDLH